MTTAPAAVLPSVLDRLLDPGSTPGSVRGRGQQLSELRDAVRRDLEALLNAHRYPYSPPPDMPELQRSLLQYGVPDFLTINAGAADAREEFRRALEEAIRRFEPRFKSVSVALLGGDNPHDRTIRLRIEALMYAEPVPDAVSFDSLIDPSNWNISVRGSRDG
jgi:type VI secretion system protein ImpF